MTTPQPPHGGNPYAQQPQGGTPYGQGMPQPQPSPYVNQGGGFPPPAPAPPQPSRTGRFGRKLLRSGIGLAVAAAVAIGLYFFNKSDAASSNIGDCFENTGSDFAAEMKKVDCGASNAEYEVISKHEDTSDQNKCKLDAGQAAYTESIDGRPTLLLCLKPLK